MDLAEYQYNLPPDLIAQRPAERRDGSRLMVLHRQEGSVEHRSFPELPGLLRPSDLLVLNDTRVFPARLYAVKDTGARIEVLLVREREERVWECLVRPGRRCPPGTRLRFGDGTLWATVEAADQPMKRLLRFAASSDFWEQVEAWGQVPLPPYIRRPQGRTDAEDRDRYQTVFARERGSVAAPTAGLHFTPELLQVLPHTRITLHVGYGTFQPIQTHAVEQHRMESEHYRIEPGAAERIRQARAAGGRVVAVGTTATRALESAALQVPEFGPMEGWTDLFIYPGFRFQIVDALVTNFHLPGSSLLLLVAAFAGKDLVLEAYREAVRQRYRFYSYGDAMLIL